MPLSPLLTTQEVAATLRVNVAKRRAAPILDPPSLMTPKEVCDFLRVNRRTVQRWCHSKPPKLSYIRLSANRIVFRRQLIEFFLKRREIRGVYSVS
jgi:excisionase family DNA binding protein